MRNHSIYHLTLLVILRPFNTYGPRQSARAVIPSIITQIAKGQKLIKLGATHPTRDFNFVLDTVNGFVKALESDSIFGEVINLGSDFEISIGNTVQAIADIMETEIEVITDQQRLRPEKSEVDRLWADNSKAKRLLGWQPKYAGLDGFKQGLQETATWFLSSSNLAQYKTELYNV